MGQITAGRILALLVGGLLVIPVSVLAGSGVEVLRSDEAGVRFSVAELQATWTARTLRDGRLVLHEVRLPGFTNSGEPTMPSLPRQTGWVVVPPGTRPEVVVVEESWTGGGSRRVMVTPTPVLYPDPESELAIPVEELLLPGETPRNGGTLPADVEAALKSGGSAAVSGPAVQLGTVTPWRGRRIVSYCLTAVQTDATGRATRVLESGTWEIRFVVDAKSGDEARSLGLQHKRTARGDVKFKFMFLNGEMLPRLLPEGAALAPVPVTRPRSASDRGGKVRRATLLAPEVKLPVSRTLLYRVVASELIDRGLLPAGIQESQIRLYKRRFSEALAHQSPPYLEEEIPIHMLGDGGEFSGDDSFLFYGLQPRDDGPHTSDGQDWPGCGDPHQTSNESNTYWLAAAEPAGTPWVRMSELSFPAASGPPVARYRRVDHIESDNQYREHVKDINADRNHFNNWFAPEIVVSAPVYAADPAATDGQLRLGVHGFSDLTVSQPRWLDVSLGTTAGEIALGAVNARQVTETVFQSPVPLTGAQLQDDTVDLILRSQTGFFYISAFLDWFELNYDALYEAYFDRLLFHGGDETGTRDLEVSGFTGPDLALVELSDPQRPSWVNLTAANLVDVGGSTTLSIRVSQPEGRRTFFAVGNLQGNGVSEILYYLAETVPVDQDPTRVSQPPDLVVITHPEFRNALQPWLQHRQDRSGGDLNVHVVEIQDVLDWFGGGLKSPEAIGWFASYAVDNWGSWALQLVGDANENMRELGQAAPSPEYYNEPTDWVSTHLHPQALGLPYQPELLMSDKWFALPDTIRARAYPDAAEVVTQMYVGRFPCNSPYELTTMIEKVRAYEPAQADDTWRRKGIFLADDAWSYGYANDAGQTLSYSWIEEGFRTSEDTLATWWQRAGLVPERLFLNEFLDPYVENPEEPRDTAEFRSYTRSDFWPVMMSTLNAGGTIFHYQGHANTKVMAHEYVIKDRPYDLRDVYDLSNNGRPWIFFGMGCHLADWAQNTVLSSTIVEPSLGEKFLLLPAGGAIAIYASSGYEFLTYNKVFSEVMLERWLFNPPTETVTGGSVRSRWMLGELLWASEADLLARQIHAYRDVVAQYILLGDPLVMLDTGPPDVTATLADAGGDTLSDQDQLLALDGTNLRAIQIMARNVGGIDRLEVTGSPGPAPAPQVTENLPPGATNHQEVTFDVELPIRPFDHQIDFHVFQTSNNQPGDDHYLLTVQVPQTAEFFDPGGNPLTLGQIAFSDENSRTLIAVVQSATNLTPYNVDQMTLSGSNLDLQDVVLTPRAGEPHLLDLEFTGRGTAGTEPPRAVVLSIDGYETEYVLQEGATPSPSGGINNLIAFPSPMRDQTRFLFESDLVASGQIQIFSVAGRLVTVLDVTPSSFNDTSAVVPWDGRDASGDRLANGVYLYRVELNGPQGSVASDVQRLVVMR